jgi:nicotinamide-nucleotide amidase
MKAEIISVGTELLLGTIVDTNAAYLGRELATLGIDTYYISAIGDNPGRLAEVLARGWQRSDVIIMTGGLGPTEDDLTREAIAALLQEPMVVQAELERDLRAFFGRRSIQMPARNIKQATLIASARAIPNPIGTAPGWWVERNGKIIVAMPGVPSEMMRMWSIEVKPKLQERSGGIVIHSRTLKIAGIGESTVEEMLGELTHSLAPTVATYAKRDGIHVRLTAKAPSVQEAETIIRPVEEQIRGIFGAAIYGVDEESLAEATARRLEELRLKLALAEYGTAGSVAAELLPALQGVYFQEAHIRPLEAAMPAEELAAIARQLRPDGSDGVGVAVALWAKQQEPPVMQTMVSIATGDQQQSSERSYNASWEQARLRIVNDALNLLRMLLFR